MTRAERTALDKWAETVDHRVQIEDFVHWVVREKGARFGLLDLNGGLDEFYGINRKDLESARLAILAGDWEVPDEQPD